MFSRYSFLTLFVALFNSFLSLRLFVLFSSVLTFFHFLLSPILLIMSCVIHGFLALFSNFPTRSLRISKTHLFILFHCTSTFPLSHPIAQRFSSRGSCSFIWVYNFSKSHRDFPFWNLTIFFNIVQTWQQVSCCQNQVSATGSVCTFFTLFLNGRFTRL